MCCGGAREIEDRVSDGTENCALVRRRQEPGVPVGGSAERPAPVVINDHVCRQVAVPTAESIGHPRPHAGEAHEDRPSVPLIVREHVVVGFPRGRVDEGQLIDDRRHTRKQVGHPRSGLAVLLEVKRTLHQRTRVSLADANLAFALQRHAVILPQVRLVIEGVDVADPTAHEEVNHLLGPRLKVRRLRKVWGIFDAFGPQAANRV